MSKLNIKKEVDQIIKESLSLPSKFKINKNLKNDDIPGLDSIAWINIILSVSKKLKIDFKVERIAEIKDIDSFYKITEELYSKKK